MVKENLLKNKKVLWTIGIICCAAILNISAFTAAKGKQETKGAPETEFQKRLSPKRLPMMGADYSGKPLPADPAYLADRLAIINHVSAYAYLIDEGRWNEWYALFSDDIVFESTVPCFGTIRTRGKEAFKRFTDLRYRGPGSEKNRTVRRHTMGNIHVVKQTATNAEVRTYMLISAAPPDGKFQVLTSGTYNASLEKRNGKWTITRWYIEVDAPVKKSTVPKIPGVEYIPDDRPECRK